MKTAALKPFASKFDATFNSQAVSYCEEKMKIRCGNQEESISDEDLADIKYAHSMENISVPIRILRANRAERIEDYEY